MTEIAEGERTRLHTLLSNAGARLREVGQEPLAIASATDKFNDAFHDDLWLAVRQGESLWEQSQFFESAEVSERSRAWVGADNREEARLRDVHFTKARAILNDLERAEWRELASRSFGFASGGPVFSLFWQFDQLWFDVSHPEGAGDDDRLYAVHAEGFFEAARRDERMDRLISDANLLRTEDFQPKVIPYLSATARRYFAPTLQDSDAADQLGTRLQKTARAIKKITRESVIVTLPAINSFDQQRRIRFASTHPQFQIRDIYFDAEHYRSLKTQRMNEDVRKSQLARFDFAPFEELESVVRELGEAKPRALFERAFSINTFGSERILFLVTGAGLYLYHGARLYELQSPSWLASLTRQDGSAIRFVGYSNPVKLGMYDEPAFGTLNINDPAFVDQI
jgi:hypothetical protein